MSYAEIAIRVKSLSKRYEIYDAPHDRLKQFIVPSIRRIVGATPKTYFREFWALKDVSFEVKRGQAVAIVGRNGSGKSTLLQAICETLAPTHGEIHTQGRIAALLELGSGFSLDFSGRENVYLNASLLGLSKAEIDERFDRIAAFADIGDFMEQPVRTYSSGMYVRLAFAVIAHVDADILVIDEALAVGDAVFSQKCMRFIRKFRETGTLLFVSHDISSVLSLCENAIWLHEGCIKLAGEAKQISEAYLQYTFQECYGEEAQDQSPSIEKNDVASTKDRSVLTSLVPKLDTGSTKNISAQSHSHEIYDWRSGAGEIVSVEVTYSEAAKTTLFGGEQIRLEIQATAHRSMDKPVLGFIVRNRLGQHLFGENTLLFTDQSPTSVKAGDSIQAEFIFQLPLLPNGKFFISAALANGDLNELVQHHWLHDACMIEISSSSVGSGQFGVPFEKISLYTRP